MQKTHEISTGNAKGRTVVFALWQDVPPVESSSVETLPVLGYRLTGQLSKYGLGYLNQKCVAEFADDGDLFELLSGNFRRSVALQVVLGGDEMFWGYIEYRLVRKERRAGRSVLRASFLTGLQSGALEFTVQDDGGGAGWFRMHRFFARLYGDMRSAGEVDVEYNSSYRIGQFSYGTEGYLLDDSYTHGVPWVPHNVIWGTETSLVDGIIDYAVRYSRLFGARTGWSFKRQEYVFYQVMPGINQNTSNYIIYAVTNSGKVQRFDFGRRSFNDYSINNDVAYKLDVTGVEICAGAGNKLDIIDKDDMSLITVAFESKTGYRCRGVARYSFKADDVIYTCWEDDSGGFTGSVKARERTGAALLWEFTDSNLIIPVDISANNNNVYVVSNGGSGTGRVFQVDRGTGQKTGAKVVNASCVAAYNDIIIVGLESGSIRVYDDMFALLDVYAVGTADVRDIKRTSSGYVVAAGFDMIKLDAAFNVVDRRTVAQDVRSGVALDDNGRLDFFAWADRLEAVSRDAYGVTFKNVTVGPSWQYIEAERVVKYDEFERVPVLRLGADNEINSGSLTINDADSGSVAYQVLDENKFLAYPVDKESVPVKSANGVQNAEVDGYFEAYEYDSELKSSVNLGVGNLKMIRGNGADETFRLYNFDWRDRAADDVAFDVSVGVEYLRLRRSVSRDARGVYRGLIDPMLPACLENGKLLLIVKYEYNLMYENTEIKESHEIKSPYFDKLK